MVKTEKIREMKLKNRAKEVQTKVEEKQTTAKMIMKNKYWENAMEWITQQLEQKEKVQVISEKDEKR